MALMRVTHHLGRDPFPPELVRTRHGGPPIAPLLPAAPQGEVTMLARRRSDGRDPAQLYG